LSRISASRVAVSGMRSSASARHISATPSWLDSEYSCTSQTLRLDYLLKVRTADIHRYRIVLGEKISSLPHVASTSTYVAMETVKD
jgi:Lrp/AsnC family leucine-responsive transcriptional regulator